MVSVLFVSINTTEPNLAEENVFLNSRVLARYAFSR